MPRHRHDDGLQVPSMCSRASSMLRRAGSPMPNATAPGLLEGLLGIIQSNLTTPRKSVNNSRSSFQCRGHGKLNEHLDFVFSTSRRVASASMLSWLSPIQLVSGGQWSSQRSASLLIRAPMPRKSINARAKRLDDLASSPDDKETGQLNHFFYILSSKSGASTPSRQVAMTFPNPCYAGELLATWRSTKACSRYRG
ncbi:uncharacterized protein SCHCODRAFT_0236154 [Schizophyllum commune H4-8]|uniref:Uncharacterized protein n=1 Tax=Schizophyllum commune (strain H4-8 / FGSC 9210) TaxID=578458 RepID=D8QA43_SCHCM|nr:uncharacterized protein SCHCODRAFT_0236154 [Schizophyllum commune H4-8]KAI5890153.1 hypothetical protein SCHCODRAFT_0236154 [Schizophyllum commune H4-8]